MFVNGTVRYKLPTPPSVWDFRVLLCTSDAHVDEAAGDACAIDDILGVIGVIGVIAEAPLGYRSAIHPGKRIVKGHVFGEPNRSSKATRGPSGWA